MNNIPNFPKGLLKELADDIVKATDKAPPKTHTKLDLVGQEGCKATVETIHQDNS